MKLWSPDDSIPENVLRELLDQVAYNLDLLEFAVVIDDRDILFDVLDPIAFSVVDKTYSNEASKMSEDELNDFIVKLMLIARKYVIGSINNTIN